MTTVQLDPGYHSLMLHLVVRDAARAIDFYRDAFGAVEEYRLVEPSGKVGHAELRIGDATFMLADEYPDYGALAPPSVGGTPVVVHHYVDDADAVVARAEACGATVLRAVREQFYGDRSGQLADPFGHRWTIATRKRHVTPAEMQQRWQAMLAGQ